MQNIKLPTVVDRKHQATALRQLIGFPKHDPLSSNLGFAAAEQPSGDLLTAIAHKAIVEGQDVLLQCYASDRADEVMLTVLVLRTAAGADLLPVELVEHSKTEPLRLVTADRTRCFMIDSRWQVAEVEAPQAGKQHRALKAARDRYEAALTQPDNGEAVWNPAIHVVDRSSLGLAA